MKLELLNDGLLIVPETDFEKEYIETNFEKGKDLKAFVKCGLSPADLIGIKICLPDK